MLRKLPSSLLAQSDQRSERAGFDCTLFLLDPCPRARRSLDPILLHFQFTFYISPSVPPLCQYSSVGAAAPRRAASITHSSPSQRPNSDSSQRLHLFTSAEIRARSAQSAPDTKTDQTDVHFPIAQVDFSSQTSREEEGNIFL